MAKRDLPEAASQVEPREGARLFAPAAARNAAPIIDLLSDVAPDQGSALELASGTGQHIVALAARLTGLSWHPSDVDPQRIASINEHVAEARLDNLAPAIALDATVPGWGASQAPRDLVLLVNLLHLISAAEAETLIREAGLALAPGGVFVIYGPFMRGGELTSEGDRDFHAQLSGRDPQIGYKDDFDMIDLLQSAGLEMAQVVEMPANNLALVARKP